MDYRDLNIAKTDTICALASGNGGAISVIRVSGKNSHKVLKKIFFPKDKDLDIEKAEGYKQYFGDIKSNSELIDEVVLSLYHEPKSYTGENSSEISCHASSFIQSKIINLLIENGARLAEAGEFTMRAYNNGKFDLAQAEAVADLIASNSANSHKIALRQMKGQYSSRIKKLREELVNFASLIELELDFAEEDVEFADRTKFFELIDRIQSEISQLIKSFELGKVIKKGIPVTIAGKPNVGKSTLLNTLLEEDKAIVSDIPGTTRDVIEDAIIIEGSLFRFIDTAGLRTSEDEVEKIGIGKSKEKLEEASIILYLIENKDDISLEEINSELLEQGINPETTEKKLIIVLNKSDKTIAQDLKSKHYPILPISAKHNSNIDELNRELISYVEEFNIQDNSIITNSRHIESLTKTEDMLYIIKDAFEQGIPTDLIAIDVREALYHLGAITGEITTDELLGNIFGKFCIGK